jgi:hypothetical protein
MRSALRALLPSQHGLPDPFRVPALGGERDLLDVVGEERPRGRARRTVHITDQKILKSLDESFLLCVLFQKCY